VEAGGAPGPVEGRPDVRVADATVDRAAAREDLALRNGRFDASLVASYARARGGFPQQGLDGSGRPVPIGGRTHNLIVGVNLMLPWRDANQGAIAAASAAVSTARHVLDARRLEATAELAAAESRDAASAGVLETLGGNARLLASRNLDVVRESYELGRATLGDVLDETRRYLEFESAYTAALVEAFDARVALTLAMGVIR
jgi:outer membrane protein TolC